MNEAELELNQHVHILLETLDLSETTAAVVNYREPLVPPYKLRLQMLDVAWKQQQRLVRSRAATSPPLNIYFLLSHLLASPPPQVRTVRIICSIL